jgi:hypothetical protein
LSILLVFLWGSIFPIELLTLNANLKLMFLKRFIRHFVSRPIYVKVSSFWRLSTNSSFLISFISFKILTSYSLLYNILSTRFISFFFPISLRGCVFILLKKIPNYCQSVFYWGHEPLVIT